MDLNVQAKPRMPRIENFADNGPVGVLNPCCTIRSGRMRRWATGPQLRRYSCRPSRPGRLRRPGPRSTQTNPEPGVWSRDEVVRVDFERSRVLCPGLADRLEGGSPSEPLEVLGKVVGRNKGQDMSL